MPENNPNLSLSDLIDQVHPNLTYPQILSLARRIGKQRAQDPATRPFLKTRIALTGNHTLSFARVPLEVFLAKHGIEAEWHVGEFDNYKQDLRDSDSALYAFKPQIVILSLDHHAVNYWPQTGDGEAEARQTAERQMKDWELLWDQVKSACGASVIQTNLALPHEQVFGHYEAKAPWGPTHYLRRLNQMIADAAPSHVSLCDAEHLSARLGKRLWFKESAWYSARQGWGFEALVQLAYNWSMIIAAILGKSRKCLVLDLDNTLWSGVVGDVGVEGIKLGPGDPVGEIFVDFQAYCRRLKEQGVLLAVCSKNNHDAACAPFLTHPDTVLKLDDFGAFLANWEDKATNLRRIAAELNIGTDSLVFVDDNPAERALVRQYLPEVAVPELPEDPALYRRTLDEQNYFEIVSLSEEDRARGDYYIAEKKRREHEVAVTDITDFLESLDQECETGPFNEINLQRIVQLINKTNQWNLTTLRLTEGEVRIRMADPSSFTLWIRHRDRFGDNGLIAAVIARQANASLEIEAWLMSCRVINRGIEDFIFNEILREARKRELSSIVGTYLPTKKNSMVAGLYERLGFERLEAKEDGSSRWNLPVKEGLDRPHFIKSPRPSADQQEKKE